MPLVPHFQVVIYFPIYFISQQYNVLEKKYVLRSKYMCAPKPSKVGQNFKNSEPVEARFYVISQYNAKQYGRSINQINTDKIQLTT